MALPQFQPMPLGRIREPFSHTDWLFEIKWDGFRALLFSDKDRLRLVSRNGNTFQSFPGLCEGLARDLKGRRCVLDGEIVCLDQHGKSQFNNLLLRRGEPFFYAFGQADSRLRAKYDEMIKTGVLRRCDCHNPNCSIYFFNPYHTVHELERLRHEVLMAFRDVYPAFRPQPW